MSGGLNPGQITRLVEAAALAPSPHNIQPARWRFTVDGRLELYEDTTRWLSVGDPTGRDNALALGAAWEGMALALSTQGLGLAEERLEDLIWPSRSPARARQVASARIVSGVRPDVLAQAVTRRQSFRGIFPVSGETEKSALRKLGKDHSALIVDEPMLRAKIAMWHDSAAAHGMRNPRFVEELFRWMRFSATDQNWARDGLSTDCMALSWIEAAVARFVLRPRMVRLLCALSLEGLLVSEAVKVRSAAGVVLLHEAEDRSWFDAGRAFYRFWLGLTRAGLCAVPMSALADSEQHAALLREAFPLPPGRRLVAILRAGKMPATRIPRSARLGAEELMLPPQA